MKTLLEFVKKLGFFDEKERKKKIQSVEKVKRLRLFGFIVRKLKHSSTNAKIRGRRGLDTR